MNQGAIKLIAIQIGGAICLPILMVGQYLEENFGLGGALSAIIIGNLLLYGFGLIACELSLSSKISTGEHAQKYFGPLGMKGFSLALLISMIGWFSIQLKAMTDLFGVSPLVLGGLITLTTLNGMRALEKISLFLVPLMAYFLIAPFFHLPSHPPISSLNVKGLSLVIAASSIAVLDMPTFFRFAKSKRSARIATTVLFTLLLPLVEAIGAYLSAVFPGDDLIFMLGGGVGVSLFILAAGWTTNNMNLYSASINLQNLFKTLPEKSAIILCASMGIVGAYLNPFEHLDKIALFAASMGGVMLIAFLMNNLKNSFNLRAAFLAGVFSLFLPLSGLLLVDAYSYAFGFSFLGGLYASQNDRS